MNQVSSFEHMEMYFQIIFGILEKFTIFIIDHLPGNEPLNGKYWNQKYIIKLS